MKYLLLGLIASLFLTMPAQAQTSLPRLKTEGNRITTIEGTPVTLRGVSLCSLEWHKPLQQIEQVTNSPQKWNVNVLRLPVQAKEWKRNTPEKYVRNYLDPAVKACTKNNVYCIIDWHDIGAWNDPEVVKTLENFWSVVAPRYATNKNILYEIFNEPTDPKEKSRDNWLAWRAQAQKWVDSVQRAAPMTVLLVGSPHWSQMPSFAVEDPFKGKNLAYTMHIYPNYPVKQWDDLFGKAADTIPLFITEWGWSSQEKSWWGIKGSEEKYGRPLREYLDAKPHINWTAWSYDPLCGPSMLGTDKDMGEFVKKWLEEVN